MNIGNVELPIISEIEELSTADVDEIKDGFKYIDVTAVKHSPSVERLLITGFVNQEAHSNNLTLEEQKEDLKKLRTTDVTDNSINYKDYLGYLLVRDVSFNDNSESKITNEVIIETRYFPWPKYYTDNKP